MAHSIWNLLLLGSMLLGPGSREGHAIQDSPEPLIPRKCHVWGAFGEGAWSRLRVTSETRDDLGNPLQVQRQV
ncbi:MAG: hypothetical protein VYE53_06260, partial [Planctomycetota bacterium]|nr:hypothetical protein [Planctomycetota bacterium]